MYLLNRLHPPSLMKILFIYKKTKKSYKASRDFTKKPVGANTEPALHIIHFPKTHVAVIAIACGVGILHIKA